MQDNPNKPENPQNAAVPPVSVQPPAQPPVQPPIQQGQPPVQPPPMAQPSVQQAQQPVRPPMQPVVPPQGYNPYTGRPQAPGAYVYAPYGYATYPKVERSGIAEIRESAHTMRGIALVVLLFFTAAFATECLAFGNLGLSVPMITAAFYAVVFWWFSDKDHSFRKFDIIMTIPIFLVALSFFFNTNSLGYFMGVLCLVVLVPLHIASISGFLPGGMLAGNPFKGFGHSVACSFQYADVPVTTLVKSRKAGKKGLGPVLIGVGIGAPLALIFLIIYYIADDIFKRFVNNIIDRLGISIGHVLLDILLGFAICLLLGGWLFAFKRLKGKSGMKAEEMQKLDGTIVGTVFVLVAIVQLLFVFVQIRYLFADAGNMPDGLDYAEYARKGFFELTATIVISVIIIMLAIAFMRRDNKGKIAILPRVALSICILANYIIVASSVKRFMIYIDGYNLSVKRVACLWLISIMAIIFLVCLIKLWWPKFKSLRYIAVVTVVMVAGFGFMNVDNLVANYNVSQYINSGFESKIDMVYLSELGPGAAPALARLVDEKTPKSDIARSSLNQIRYHNLNTSWRDITTTQIAADKIYERLEINENYEDGYDDYGYDSRGRNSEWANRNGEEGFLHGY